MSLVLAIISAWYRTIKVSSRFCHISMYVPTKQSWRPTLVGEGAGTGTGADMVQSA